MTGTHRFAESEIGRWKETVMRPNAIDTAASGSTAAASAASTASASAATAASAAAARQVAGYVGVAQTNRR